MRLQDAIAHHFLVEWSGRPLVEPLIFGTDRPDQIARAIADFCRTNLGAAPIHCRFYETSVGCVAGLDLADGAAVVVKAHSPHASRERLVAAHAVQAELASTGFPCPKPLALPSPLGAGLGTAAELMEGGSRADARNPAIRYEMAARLAEIASRIDPARLPHGLGGSWLSSLPPDRLWPRPHSPLFDFDATASGAEWIDALGRRARSVALAGDVVVGHFDWRREHLRFEEGRIVASFDWDSLHIEREPVMLGSAAHAFTADWSEGSLPAAPTLADMRGFSADYQRARGGAFSSSERLTVGAACVYALAYTSRCTHALGPDVSDRQRAYPDLLRSVGETLLADGL